MPTALEKSININNAHFFEYKLIVETANVHLPSKAKISALPKESNSCLMCFAIQEEWLSAASNGYRTFNM